MKRKGFTLVELLAVIAILAILVIIALPNVMKMFNNAKKSAFETEVREIYINAKQQWMSDSLSVSSNQTYVKCKTEKCGKQLNMNIRNDLEYYIEMSGTGKVTSMYITDGTYQYKYEGTGLEKNDIGEAEIIAEIEDDIDKITITCDGPEETPLYIGKPINDCTFDEQLVQGIEYTNGQYVYKYKQEKNTSNGWSNISQDGWGVALKDINTTNTINSKLCTSINGKPIISMANMFYNAKNLTEIDVSSFDTSNVYSMNNMFYNAGYNSNNFKIIGLDRFDTSNVIKMNSMFKSCGFKATNVSIGKLDNWDVSNVTDFSSMFSDFGYNSNIINIGNLKNWNVSKVTNMSSMFSGMGYKSIEVNIGDLSNWNTNNVNSMRYMFEYFAMNASNFDIGKLDNWNTSKVKYFDYIFSYLGYKSEVWNIGNLSNWNTANAINMKGMFSYSGKNSRNWNIGDLSNWNTSGVTNMSCMFQWAGGYEENWNIGDLSNWNVSKVTDMSSMFYYAAFSSKRFNIGNLSRWNTSKVTNMSYMFNQAGYSSKEEWYIGTFNVYANDITHAFNDVRYPNATINIRKNPSKYDYAFGGYNNFGGKKFTVNYSSSVTNINNIINTRQNPSYAVKGYSI